MAEVIRMPKMSDTMTEGVISKWLVKVGDEVEIGTILAEVETDKAVMELESYEEGVMLHIGVKAAESIEVDGIVAVIGQKDEDYKHLLNNIETKNTTETHTVKMQDENNSVNLSNINAVRITMPKMSDTMTEGVISKWLVKVGDEVEVGTILAEVETDKATMELECYDDGIVLYLGVEAGKAIAVDQLIAIIGEKGANFEALININSKLSKQSENEDTKVETQTLESQATKQSEVSISDSLKGRLKASPLAKRLAKAKGYDLNKIMGSGENGRIVKKDIENYQSNVLPQNSQSSYNEQSATPITFGQERYEEKPISQMRKSIAKSLSKSKFTAPHFYLTSAINMDEAIKVRKKMNVVSSVKISFNDIIIKAVALSLKQNPLINTYWLEDKIRYNDHVHIGVAVAVNEGLLVPVVRFSDQKTLSQISTEVKMLSTKARDRKLQPEEWQGSTFTVSNLGMFGIDSFTAIINSPDSCILAVGGINPQPVVKDGNIVAGNIMKVTLSCDHRLVDGVLGAKFLQSFKSFMEEPTRMLV